MSDEEMQSSARIHPRTIRRLCRYLLRQRGLLAAACLLILVATGATLVEPRLFGYAIDEGIVPRQWTLVQRLAWILLVVEFVRVSSQVAHGYLFEWLGQRVMQELRLELFSHLQAIPVSTFDRQPVGRLVTRVTNDTSALAEMFSAGIVAMLGNLLVIVGILTWLVALNLRLGLIAAAVFPVLLAVSAGFSKRLKIAYGEARNRLSTLNAFLAENILGMRVIHLFNRQARHRERFRAINQRYVDAQISSVRVFAFFQPTISWATGIAMALVIWYGGGMAHRGEIQLGVLVAYFSYVMSLFQPVREIADKWNVFLSGITAAERVFAMLDWAPEHDPAAAASPVVRARGIVGSIVFENVWFAYEEERWVLKDFSLEIRPGMKVGVVGHTGAGKTTLISLLMRFYEPQKGRILIDGRDIREFDKRALRAAIGIVQQDVFLFSGSIRDNVTLWRQPDEGSRRAVERALDSMGMGSWLDSSAELQERGSNLSMGQRQVLAFSRALSSDPAIWILDEATANIDSETERLLEKSLKQASAGRTSILIAHRLATVRDADLILVLHQGQLLEKGDHRGLMAQDGLYARLYRYQDAIQPPPASVGE